jgi:hypothetical protein
MSHLAQIEFVESVIRRFNLTSLLDKNILEVGSQDINGNVSSLFEDTPSTTWVGIDIGAGKNVDLIVPGELIQLPSSWADISISTECFEHTSAWKEILLNMIRITKEFGIVILTFGGVGRKAHGTIDTDTKPSPYTNNYYKNISLVDLVTALDIDKYFSRFSIEINHQHCDTYFWGIRNQNTEYSEWLSTEECLARARGQLGVLVKVNKELKKENKDLKKRLLKKRYFPVELLSAVSRFIRKSIGKC